MITPQREMNIVTDGPSYYIEYFHSVSLTKADIDQLGPENLSYLSTVLFAANELFVFQKILSSNIKTPKQRDTEILTLSFIQQSTILRTLSAKVLEFIKLFEDQNKIWKRGGFNDEIERMRSHTAQLLSLKGSKFYQFTKEMRNSLINHYLVSATLKNLNYVSENADYSFYLHQELGNSFFPIGEEVVFFGFVNRHFGDDGEVNSFEEKSVFIKEWVDWVLEALKWANNVVETFSIFIILEKLGGKIAKRKPLFIDPEIVADIHKFRSPLIFRDRREKN